MDPQSLVAGPNEDLIYSDQEDRNTGGLESDDDLPWHGWGDIKRDPPFIEIKHRFTLEELSLPLPNFSRQPSNSDEDTKEAILDSRLMNRQKKKRISYHRTSDKFSSKSFNSKRSVMNDSNSSNSQPFIKNLKIKLSQVRPENGPFFKPFSLGWKREIVTHKKSVRDFIYKSVLYHPPNHGIVIKNADQLSIYLENNNTGLDCDNFSFKSQLIGAPKEQEFESNSEPDVIEIASSDSDDEASLPKQRKTDQFVNSDEVEFSNRISHTQLLRKQQMKPKFGDEDKPSVVANVKGLKVKMFGKLESRNVMSSGSPSSTQSKPPPPDNVLFSSSTSMVMETPLNNTLTPPLNNQYVVLPNSQNMEIPPSLTILSPMGPTPQFPMPILSVTPNPIVPNAINGTTSLFNHGSNLHFLKPGRSGFIPPCSIHCPGHPGLPPSLTCGKCQKMFHPKCVSLFNLRNIFEYAFFCNECCDNGNYIGSQSNVNRINTSGDINTLPEHHTNNCEVAESRPVSNLSQVDVSSPPIPNSEISQIISNLQPQPPPAAKQRWRKAPVAILRQRIVNIGGHKYVVVPKSGSKMPSIPIDSPPPSPPLPPLSSESTDSLPFILRPKADGRLPSFGLEKTTDGKYLLIPHEGDSDVNLLNSNGTLNRQRENTQEDSRNGKFFYSNLSGSYFAMIQVFKYLTLQERIQASRVCKLWFDLAHHPSLCHSVSLKNSRVYDWIGFCKYLNRTKATNLDLSKLIYVGSTSSTWNLINAAAGNFRFVTSVHLPRLTSVQLVNFARACPRLETLIAKNVLLKCREDLQLTAFAEMPCLKNLQLKSPSIFLKLTGEVGDSSRLACLSRLAKTLSHLSLLSMRGFTQDDFKVLPLLINLETLELGDCSYVFTSKDSNENGEAYRSLGKCCRLRNLRLERGVLNEDAKFLAPLRNNLRRLELVDFELVPGFGPALQTWTQTYLSQLLIIPFYPDDEDEDTTALCNMELVNCIIDMSELTHLYLGVTNEWVKKHAQCTSNVEDESHLNVFPIKLNGSTTKYSLLKLYRSLSNARPKTEIKVLKMSAISTTKQFIANLLPSLSSY